MSELWVLLELVPAVALALLVGTAALAHRKEDVLTAGLARRKEDDEPKWWPDFEREFGLYVARTARKGAARER